MDRLLLQHTNIPTKCTDAPKKIFTVMLQTQLESLKELHVPEMGRSQEIEEKQHCAGTGQGFKAEKPEALTMPLMLKMPLK